MVRERKRDVGEETPLANQRGHTPRTLDVHRRIYVLFLHPENAQLSVPCFSRIETTRGQAMGGERSGEPSREGRMLASCRRYILSGRLPCPIQQLRPGGIVWPILVA